MKEHHWHLRSLLSFFVFAFMFLAFSSGICAQNGETAKSNQTSKTPVSAEIQPSAGDRPAVAWIRTHATPLTTVEAGHGFVDMQPLKQAVGDARIVALGEATHGTREFFQLKHRMIEFLASQKGFTIFSIEANMPEAYRLNDFVLTGKGDPRELLKGMYFWTWNTQEVLELILWMREFNKSGKGHIEFTGFDMQTATVSMDIVRTFVQQHDAPYLETVNRTYQGVARAQRPGNGGRGFGVGTATFPIKAAAGKHIKYSGFIRTEEVKEGFAGLWWRVDGEPGTSPLAFDNMEDRGPKSTTPWTRYEISLDVPANAKNINFGVLHTGSGTAWFDSLQVEIDGQPYTDAGLFDLDYESPTPRGFFTGGQGYEVTLDPTVAHSGNQSLRSKLIKPKTPAPEPATVDNKQLVLDCKQILEHMETGRAALVKASNAKDVDWGIQNARLVVQYMQLNTGEQQRDQSMAENVKWIADQNPGAKLILWAHNGHIQYEAPGAWHPMGEYLRKMFGGQLMNFGFAFDQGSFRAVEIGKGLHDFTVASGPEDSLDRTLSAAGMPVLALDLRQLPKQGPVAEWFDQPHRTRSIGAVYSDANAASFFADVAVRHLFDVLLFVDKTTAARGN
jgi:erythromycin esterase-like protein